MVDIVKQVSGASLINTKNMNPFVATLSPTYNSTIDYSKIKSARISSMMFFAGELFDINHREKSSYMNPYLPKLVKGCNAAGMPYSLYVNVRATTEIEADKECRTLYYVISQFAPKLGIWLSLQTTAPSSMIDKILEVYYKYILLWGLKDRCGLYIKTSQVTSFTWNSFNDRFYLWAIDPMDVNLIDTELLTPEVFEVPD